MPTYASPELFRALQGLTDYIWIVLVVMLFREIFRLFTGGGESGATPTLNKAWNLFKKSESDIQNEEGRELEDIKYIGAIGRLNKIGMNNVKRLIINIETIVKYIQGGRIRKFFGRTPKTIRNDPEVRAQVVEKLKEIHVEEAELKRYVVGLRQLIEKFQKLATTDQTDTRIKNEVKAFLAKIGKETEFGKIEAQIDVKAERILSDARARYVKKIQEMKRMIDDTKDIIEDESRYFHTYDEAVKMLESERYEMAVSLFEEAKKILRQMLTLEVELQKLDEIERELAKGELVDEKKLETFLKLEFNFMKKEKKDEKKADTDVKKAE